MNVLVINCGSSSLKYQLIDSETEAVLAKGLCERIGIDGRLVYQKTGLDKEITEAAMPTHKQAIQMVLDAIVNPKTGALKSLAEVDAVGHRVVHGGEKFASSVVLTEEVLAQIEECNDLAPLHNPANLIGIRACQELMPNVPMVGVFDTAFHQTMPKKAYLYGLPHEYYEKYKVRRYGFHGTSHSFVSKRLVEYLGMDLNNSKVIVAHLGNGASVSAVVNGKCVDTSMGLTPLEGLVMGTRSGDIDPAIMEFIAKKENLDIEGVMNVLNKKSGVQGMTGISSDFRDLEIETFVHGAMCISYSGRCLLSNYFTGRDANRGACTHPCRWKYSVVEEKRPGEYFPVYENERGTYIFNSKDLCMIEHIPDLLEAGIDSFKIEGRMKTALYVATVARTYRKAIDDYLESPEKYQENMPWYLEQIKSCTYRQFTTGFFYGKPSEETQIYDNNTYEKGYTYLGIVGPKNEKGMYRVEQKNKFSVGEQIEVMKPDGRNVTVTVRGLMDEKGEPMESCPHPQQIFYVDLGMEPDEYDILRRREEEAIALD